MLSGWHVKGRESFPIDATFKPSPHGEELARLRGGRTPFLAEPTDMKAVR